MRRPLILLSALLVLAPVPLIDAGDLTAHAAGRDDKQQKRKNADAPKKNERRTRTKPTRLELKGTPAAETPTPEASAPPQRGPTRIDFDDRLIQGQSNKSGAVYLYDRKELETRSMVKKRESFREEIVKTVYDDKDPRDPGAR